MIYIVSLLKGLLDKRVHFFLFFYVFIKVEDIIKKILLNMNYDSRKTLNENKNYILKEDKTDPEKNIEYKKETAPDGSTFDLRTDAYEIVKVYTPTIKDKNLFSETCQWIKKYPKYSDYKFKDIETCNKDYTDGFIKSLGTNFVKSFKVKDKLDVFDEKEWKFEFCGSFYNYDTKRVESPNKWKFSGYFAKRPLEEDKNCGTLEYISGNQKKGTDLSGTQDKGSKEGDSKSAMIKTGSPILGSQTGNKTLGIGLGKGAGGSWYGTMGGKSSNVPPDDDEEREVDFK